MIHPRICGDIQGQMANEFVYKGLETFLNVLGEQKGFAEQDGFDLLTFSNVEQDFVNRHETMIEREKIRIYEYAPNKQQLIVKMPICIFFLVQGTVFKYLTEKMEKKLEWKIKTGY